MTNFYMTTFRGVKQHSYAACDAALAASTIIKIYEFYGPLPTHVKKDPNKINSPQSFLKQE